MPKTINDIIPPSRRRAMEMEADSGMPPPPSQHTSSYDRPRKKFPWGLVIAILIILAVSVGALYAFAGARVEVEPTSGDASITGDFIATAAAGELPFSVVAVDKIASKKVEAESTETVNDAAQGTVTVSNTSEEIQKFVKNTRFETPDGLIFKAQDAITVPAGSPGAPGTVKITVYAESAGDKYNVGPTSFTLPGLASSDLGTQVTGKSEEAMSGGFSGTRPSVSEATREKEYPAMEKSLTEELETMVEAQVPQGYVLIPGSIFTTFTPQPDTSSAAGSVEVRLKGTATAVIFPEGQLAAAIAARSLGVYGGEAVKLADADELTLTATTAPTDTEFAFTLSGSTTILWVVDPSRIAEAVAGKKRDAAQVILAGYPEVEKAVLVLRPFWASTFPADPAEITVTVAGEEAPK